MYEKNAGWSVNSVCLNSATTLLGDLGHLISLLLTRSTCSIEGLSQVISKALSSFHVLWLCALKESQ